MNEMLKPEHILNVNDIASVPVDTFWNFGDKELLMHKIHSYPAKFPAFITTKALEYYTNEFGHEPALLADIFCGCGTVALEASRKNIPFWGCDINPVATLIAKTKSSRYKSDSLNKYYKKIISSFNNNQIQIVPYNQANERLRYWYESKQYSDLYRLREAILINTLNGKYRSFFECAFSNILKPTSKWLTKSIKPQVDPNKIPCDVLSEFNKQFKLMYNANEENLSSNNTGITNKPKIEKKNVLKLRERKSKFDMIITSPPYVTSYEYADLHQLSSLWLGYAEDYRTLRSGSIGSGILKNISVGKKISHINKEGEKIVTALREKDKLRAITVENYFLDMENVVRVCHKILSDDGIVLFVIGDTEYKGVKIKNSYHLAKSLMNQGFDVYASKRKITNKLLTPYRDSIGRFTTDSTSRKIYNEEFIIIGKKGDLYD